MMGIDIKAKFAKPSCFLGSNANATKVNIVINAIMVCFLMDYIDWFFIAGIFIVIQMFLAILFYNNPYFVEETTLVRTKASVKAKDEDGELYV